MSEVLHFDERRIAELCDLATVTDWLEQAWEDLGRGEADTTLRVRAGDKALMASAMSATWPRHRMGGGKLYLTHPGGFAFLVALFSPDGGLLATFDGAGLTATRTAAATAVALRRLKPPHGGVCTLFGTGAQAKPHVLALAQELDVADLRIWGRDPAKAEALAAWANRQGVPARPAGADEAVDGAGVVVTVTASYEPVFDGARLDAGALVCAVGSTKADRREVDAASVRRAGFVVSDSAEGARIEAGDLIGAAADGAFDWDRLVDLADVVAGRVDPPDPGSCIVLFESQGVALQDVVAATLAYQRGGPD